MYRIQMKEINNDVLGQGNSGNDKIAFGDP